MINKIEYKWNETYILTDKNGKKKMSCFYDGNMYCQIYKENGKFDYSTNYGLDFFNMMVKEDGYRIQTIKEYEEELNKIK